MKSAKLFNLLISCPGDITTEVNLIKKVIENFNELYADKGIVIQPRYWTHSAFPQANGHPQSLLNKQYIINCDAAVALFWTRFGTPTDSYGSGTEEEIEIMLNAGKQVFLYFSEVPMAPGSYDSKQFSQVTQFKKKYQKRGIYWTYDTPEKFYELFTRHLAMYIIPHFNNLNPPRNIKYKLSVFSDRGSLFLYSSDSPSKEQASSYSVSETEWYTLTHIIKKFVALMFHTSEDLVSINPFSKLSDKKCAPLDGYLYYDKDFRIDFSISFINTKKHQKYDSFHIDASDTLSLSFFKNGDYIYHTVPVDSTLGDLGIDEDLCLSLSRELIQFLNPYETIVTGDFFEPKVYSDKSGSFELQFITK